MLSFRLAHINRCKFASLRTERTLCIPQIDSVSNMFKWNSIGNISFSISFATAQQAIIEGIRFVEHFRPKTIVHIRYSTCWHHILVGNEIIFNDFDTFIAIERTRTAHIYPDIMENWSGKPRTLWVIHFEIVCVCDRRCVFQFRVGVGGVVDRRTTPNDRHIHSAIFDK